MATAKTMGPPADCTVVVAVGDGLASDVELARWTTGSGGYEDEPPLDFAAITPSRRDFETARDRGGMAFLASSCVPLVATNLVLTQSNRAVFAPIRMVSCGWRPVAILALAQGPDDPDVRSEDPLTSLRAQLEGRALNSDIVILLSNAGVQVDDSIASKLGAIDVLVSAGSIPGERPKVLPGIGVLMIPPAYEGQSVGVARLTFDRHGKLIRHAWDKVVFIPQG